MSAIFENTGELDDAAIRAGVLQMAINLLNKYPDVGSILLECSDLPPYAYDIQAATGLPVFDFNTMINYVHNALSRRAYVGLI